MNFINNFIPVLGIISVLTTLVVEAFKKLLDENGVKYSCNILACIVSTVLSTLYCVGYVILNDIQITAKIGVYGVTLVFLAWLISMTSYDKVVQALKQIGD